MATFILFWNPAISSYKLDEYRQFITDRPTIYDLNWSVWEHEKAQDGDEFYMVRCKSRKNPETQAWEPYIDETTGICMAGHFCSDPIKGEDWSGKGRPTYYMELDIEHASDPDECVILSTAELMAAIPDFDWTGGHSGRLLDEESAEKLRNIAHDAIFEKYDQIWSPYLIEFID